MKKIEQLNDMFKQKHLFVFFLISLFFIPSVRAFPISKANVYKELKEKIIGYPIRAFDSLDVLRSSDKAILTGLSLYKIHKYFSSHNADVFDSPKQPTFILQHGKMFLSAFLISSLTILLPFSTSFNHFISPSINKNSLDFYNLNEKTKELENNKEKCEAWKKNTSKNIRNLCRKKPEKLRNVYILHGKPGTGKTSFLQIYKATHKNTILLQIPKDLFSSENQVTVFNRLLEEYCQILSNNISQKVLFYIDEADQLPGGGEKLLKSFDGFTSKIKREKPSNVTSRVTLDIQRIFLENTDILSSISFQKLQYHLTGIALLKLLLFFPIMISELNGKNFFFPGDPSDPPEYQEAPDMILAFYNIAITLSFCGKINSYKDYIQKASSFNFTKEDAKEHFSPTLFLLSNKKEAPFFEYFKKRKNYEFTLEEILFELPSEAQINKYFSQLSKNKDLVYIGKILEEKELLKRLSNKVSYRDLVHIAASLESLKISEKSEQEALINEVLKFRKFFKES